MTTYTLNVVREEDGTFSATLEGPCDEDKRISTSLEYDYVPGSPVSAGSRGATPGEAVLKVVQFFSRIYPLFGTGNQFVKDR